MTQCYFFSRGRRLLIANCVLETFHKYGQCDPVRPEAGGILLGRHLLESPDMVIDEATPPQASDQRSRFSFFRSEMHNTIATRRWKESGGKIAYLGLWHTHPEAIPTPSRTDLDDWRKALRQDQFEGCCLFFIIVGTRELGCWVGRRSGPFTRFTRLFCQPR